MQHTPRHYATRLVQGRKSNIPLEGIPGGIRTRDLHLERVRRQVSPRLPCLSLPEKPLVVVGACLGSSLGIVGSIVVPAWSSCGRHCDACVLCAPTDCPTVGRSGCVRPFLLSSSTRLLVRIATNTRVRCEWT